MKTPHNAFKRAILTQQRQIGLWCSLCSPIAIEIVSYSGFDWLLLDTEHAPNDIGDILAQLQAAQAGPTSCVVRLAWNDMVLMKRYLDLGAQTLLLPFVQTRDEATRAVEFSRYPPNGVRGITRSSRASHYGRVRNYLDHASEEICLLVQIETREALEQIHAIATVDGIDGVFIGPNDLSASLGHLGNPQHPEVQAAIKDASTALRKIGKAAGILTSDGEEALKYISWGFSFVAVGSDVGILSKNSDTLAKRFRL